MVINWDEKAPNVMLAHVDKWFMSNIQSEYGAILGGGWNLQSKSNWNSILNDKSKKN